MLIAEYGFIFLTIICLFGIDFVFFNSTITDERKSKYRRNYWIITLGWLSAVGVLSINDFFNDFNSFPPKAIFLIVIPLVLFIVLYRQKGFKEYVNKVPSYQLIALQSFRIPVEIFLWQLYLAEVLPLQMTFEECNFDVITGLTAPFMAYYCYKRPGTSRNVMRIWNVFGLLLLANIVLIAIISMPTPFVQFTDRIPNTIVATYPVSFLPAFLVPMAYYLHFLSLRQR